MGHAILSHQVPKSTPVTLRMDESYDLMTDMTNWVLTVDSVNILYIKRHETYINMLGVYLTISTSSSDLSVFRDWTRKYWKRDITTNIHHGIICNSRIRQTTLEGSRRHQSKGEAGPASYEGNPLPPSRVFFHHTWGSILPLREFGLIKRLLCIPPGYISGARPPPKSPN